MSSEKIKNQKLTLKNLKNKFEDQRVIVLGCSPYLTDYDKFDLEKVLSKNKVIGIKQAYKIFKNFVDIHVYNCCNIERYDYGNQKPLVVEASSTIPSSNSFDMFFHIKERDAGNSLSSVCSQANSSDFLNNWSLSNYEENILFSAWRGLDIHLRPFGPGIMSELIFYLCEHLGFSETILIGCDNEPKENQTHFYRNEKNEYEAASNDPHKTSPWLNFEKEKKMFLDLMTYWNDWFLKKNKKIKLISNFNNYPDCIEKLNLNELL